MSAIIVWTIGGTYVVLAFGYALSLGAAAKRGDDAMRQAFKFNPSIVRSA